METTKEKRGKGKTVCCPVRRAISFSELKRLSGLVRSYEAEFRDLYLRGLSEARGRMHKETVALRDSSEGSWNRVKGIYADLESDKAVPYLIGEAEALVSRGEYLEAARMLAMGLVISPMRESGRQGLDRESRIRGFLDGILESCIETKGFQEAERMCRMLTFSGFPVVLMDAKQVVEAALEAQEEAGNFGRAFELAAYWSMLAYEPPVPRERAERLFALSKGL